MEGLDKDARTVLERNVDDILKKPKGMEETFSSTLRAQGIEPNLETVLSFITGLLLGIVEGIYDCKYDRLMNSDERDELDELLKRRAWEIRQALMSTRIGE